MREVHFLVDSSQHCYTNGGSFYTADASGPSGGGTGGVSMLEWTRALVGAPAYGATECEGALLDEAEWDQSATSYCAAEMDGKAFQGPDGSSGVEMR